MNEVFQIRIFNHVALKQQQLDLGNKTHSINQNIYKNLFHSGYLNSNEKQTRSKSFEKNYMGTYLELFKKMSVFER